MATPIVVALQALSLEGKKDEKVVKWLKHYSSEQSILIVGDGDLSFSRSLATAFGSGENLVATSLDSYGLFDPLGILLLRLADRSSLLSCFLGVNFLLQSSWTANLISMYGKAESNVTKLKRMGATVLHGVDVKNMKSHIDLKFKRFDRIVFNFPHAGFIGKENQVSMITYVSSLFITFYYAVVISPHYSWNNSRLSKSKVHNTSTDFTFY
jgi:25S rRNA (uracil2634-N3)-methyltransferase